jgi:hypothetical protein
MKATWVDEPGNRQTVRPELVEGRNLAFLESLGFDKLSPNGTQPPNRSP